MSLMLVSLCNSFAISNNYMNFLVSSSKCVSRKNKKTSLELNSINCEKNIWVYQLKFDKPKKRTCLMTQRMVRFDKIFLNQTG